MFACNAFKVVQKAPLGDDFEPRCSESNVNHLTQALANVAQQHAVRDATSRFWRRIEN